MPAKLRRPHCSPGDAVARVVEAAKRARQSAGVRQEIVQRHEDVLQYDLARRRGTHGQLACDLRRFETGAAALNDKAADRVIEFRPYHRDIRDGRICDPHFRAVKPETTADALSARGHGAWIRTMVRLRQAETS